MTIMSVEGWRDGEKTRDRHEVSGSKGMHGYEEAVAAVSDDIERMWKRKSGEVSELREMWCLTYCL